MPQFTQLNLNAKSTKSGAGIPAREAAYRGTKTTMLVGLVTIAIVSGAALLALNGCSKKESPKSQAITSPQPTMPSPVVNSASSPATTEAQPSKPVKKVKKSPSVTYVNRTYGLSLQYPRKYSLKTGDEAQLELNGSSTPMDFSKPGGITVAAIEMPSGMYPGTDLNQAFLMVNVNHNLSAGECELQSLHTSREDAKSVSQEQPVSGSSSTSPENSPSGEKVKIGGRDFTEQKIEDTTNRSEAKYYHVFENGACYEFALALGTGAIGSDNETKPIDRDAVFAKLEKILATVQIKSVSEGSPKQETGESKCGADTGDSGCDSKPVGNSPVSVQQPTNPNTSSAQTTEPVPQKFEPTPVHPED